MSASERTPLVANAQHKDETTVFHEIRLLVGYACPLIAMSLMRYFMSGVSVYSLSQLGTLELAAGNLGLVTVNVGGFSIIIGLVASLDTLANQASNSSNPKLASLYAMRTAVVCCIVMPVLFLVQWNSLSIFGYILPHADPEMLRLASLYCKAHSFAFPALVGYECIRRYLQSFGHLNGPLWAYLVGVPVSCFLNWLLVHGPAPYRLGFIGAPIGVVVSFWCLFGVIIVYALFVAPRQHWAGFSFAVFQDLSLNFRYGFSGVLSVCSEWWAFEFISLGATYLGIITQASSAIYMTTLSACWQFPLALSMASSLRVGNLLGAQTPHKAHLAAKVAQAATGVFCLVNAALLLGFKSQFGKIFSQDSEVIRKVDQGMFIIATVVLFDGMQGVNSGILRGAGQPALAAQVNLLGYWLVGLPAGAIMTYKLQDIRALWSGLAIAVLCTSSMMGILILRNDWEARASEAQDRMLKSGEQVRDGMGQEEDVRIDGEWRRS